MKHVLLSFLAVIGLCGCASIGSGGKQPLKVGFSPTYPPMIFSQDGDPAGVEYDLMRKLGRELDRPVTAVSMPFDELIDALVAGKIDIIMSGLSVTKARQVKIAFTDPWMNAGLGVLMRKAQSESIQTVDDVLRFSGNIGVLVNTTADDFVRRNAKNARVIKIASAADAGVLLQRRTIDLFIHDIPSVAWQAASNEAELTVLMTPLNREEIAWGVRRDDTELLAAVNPLIAAWKADGSLDATITKWIPYYGRFK